MSSRVAVVGAGLTGLVTASALCDTAQVVVFEGADRVGGQIRTRDLAGNPVDVGADAFLARQPEADALARRLGLGPSLVEPSTGRVWLEVGGRRRPLPAGVVLGVPTSIRALSRSRVLSLPALARAAVEPLLPGRPPSTDRTVADLVGRRFGAGVVDALVDPLLGGVYAGDPVRLSAQAATPPVWEAAVRGGSLSRSLRSARTAAPAGPVFRTLAGGLAQLPRELAARLGQRVRTRTHVERIARDGNRWRVVTAGGGDEEFDAVVVAVPAPIAAGLLQAAAPDAATGLSRIRTASVGVVSLAYPWAATSRAMDGSGVLVARGEGRLVKAVTVSSRKWPHLADADHFLLRASVGRIDDHRWHDLDDDELVARVDAEVCELVGIEGSAATAMVSRWPDALPQYDLGHLATTAAIRTDLPRGLLVGGAAFGGVGLPARIRDAEHLAAGVLAAVT